MSKISLKHSGGNVVSLNSPTSAPTSADVAFKLPNQDGSANEFLKTDGSGNLSFGAVTDTNDYVKLQKVSSGGGSSQYLIFDNLDVATYKYFDFIISLVPETDNQHPYFRFRTGGASGSSISSSHYGWAYTKHYSSNQLQHRCKDSETFIRLSDAIGNNTNNAEVMAVSMRIHFADSSDNGASASLANFVTWGYCVKNDSDAIRNGHGSGQYHENASTYPTGFEIYMESGAINAHTYTLYGLKR